MDGLLATVEEAAAIPQGDNGHLRVGDVVGALADAAFEMRRAYWGYPHPGSVGDQPLVIVVDGREYAASTVQFANHRIEVQVEPLAARVDDRDGTTGRG